MSDKPEQTKPSHREKEGNTELAEAERLVRELPYPDWGQHAITRAAVWTVIIFVALWWSGLLSPWWALLFFPCALYYHIRRTRRGVEKRSAA